MKCSIAAAAAMATVVIASPTPIYKRATAIYNSSNPVTSAVCAAASGSSQPLGDLYPVASMLGSIVTPALDTLMGSQSVEDLDSVADDLCVSAQQDTTSDDGICQDTTDAIRSFVDAKTPLDQSQQFGCLLDLLCIANKGPQIEGTCNQLLAASDCIANRIIGVSNLECYN